MSTPATDQAKQQLLGHIRAIENLREQRREINADIAERKKIAKEQGFIPRRIEEVVRWMEECEKKGRDAVDEAEAMFDLYRGVVDGEGRNLSEMMDDARDRALLKIFAPDDQLAVKGPTRRQKAVSDALAGASISRMNRGGG